MDRPDPPMACRRMLHALRWRFACALLALAALWPGGHAPAQEAEEGGAFRLLSASVREVDGVYLLDGVARLELGEPVRSALDSGVALHITWEMEIERERSWWLNAEVASVVQRYRLDYHALSLQYIVTNLNTGERRSFTRLSVALDHIGVLIGFPVVDSVLIDGGGRHVGFVRIRLEHGQLPLPLRPTALISPAWNLESEWRPWRFE